MGERGRGNRGGAVGQGTRTRAAISCGRLAKVGEQRQKPKDDNMLQKNKKKNSKCKDERRKVWHKKNHIPKPRSRNQEPGHRHVGHKKKNQKKKNTNKSLNINDDSVSFVFNKIFN